MKRLKPILAVLLSLVMIYGMTATAMAAEASNEELINAVQAQVEAQVTQAVHAEVETQVRAAVRELWQKLRLMDLERPEEFRIQGRDLMELEYIVHAYLLYQTDRPLRSLEFLRQVGDTARPAAAVDK